MTKHIQNTVSTTTKRGRPSIGDKPMTAAERQRISRERKSMSGISDVIVKMKQTHLNTLKRLSETSDVSRSELLEAILNMSLWNVINAVEVRAKLKAEGKNDNEIQTHFYNLMRQGPSDEEIHKLEVLLKI